MCLRFVKGILPVQLGLCPCIRTALVLVLSSTHLVNALANAHVVQEELVLLTERALLPVLQPTRDDVEGEALQPLTVPLQPSHQIHDYQQCGLFELGDVLEKGGEEGVQAVIISLKAAIACSWQYYVTA